jgi:DEP domain-containing protein 5
MLFFFLRRTECQRIYSFRHYYYRLIGEYSVHMTPKYWFRRNTDDGRPAYYHLNPPKQIAKPVVARRNKKRLILSQTMVIDVDPFKVCCCHFYILMHLSNALA